MNKFTAVIIPSIWGTPEVFEEMKNTIAETETEVVVVDIHIYGTGSFFQYVSVVEEHLASISGPVVLIGHSMGGLIAQFLARDNMEKIVGIILLGSAMPRGIVGCSWKFAKKIVRYIPTILFGQNFLPSFEDFQAVFANNMTEAEAWEVFDKLIPDSCKAARDTLIGIKIDEINRPVFVLSGTDDLVYPLKLQRKLARRFPNGKLMVVNCDHNSYPAACVINCLTALQ